MEMLWGDLVPGDEVKITKEAEEFYSRSSWINLWSKKIHKVIKVDEEGNEIKIWFLTPDSSYPAEVFFRVDKFAGKIPADLYKETAPKLFEIVKLVE